MTDPMPTIMQAAERLRRIANEDQRDVYDTRKQEPGHNPSQAYPGDYSDWLASKYVEADRITLADFALSILPKGERPVAMEQPESETCQHDENAAWGIGFADREVFSTDCCCKACWPGFSDEYLFFKTEAEADWMHHELWLKELIKVAEASAR